MTHTSYTDKISFVRELECSEKDISVLKKTSESGCGRERAREKCYHAASLSLLLWFSFTLFFRGASATLSCIQERKVPNLWISLHQDKPRLVREEQRWWLLLLSKGNGSILQVESEHWHSFQCSHAPSPTTFYTGSFTKTTSQKQTQKTVQLSIQSCNCFLKLIKIVRLANLILVNLGLPPLDHSIPFICLLFSHLLAKHPQKWFIFLFFLEQSWYAPEDFICICKPQRPFKGSAVDGEWMVVGGLWGGEQRWKQRSHWNRWFNSIGENTYFRL